MQICNSNVKIPDTNMIDQIEPAKADNTGETVAIQFDSEKIGTI